MLEVSTFFNSAYSGSERYWWKQPQAYSTVPEDHAGSLIAQQTLRYARVRGPGRAIDLGSGEGADAIRLAKLGWEVEAVELTHAGAAKIRHFSSQAQVSVRIHIGDIMRFDPKEPYDLVICNGVLHYIREKDEMCQKMRDMTNDGGANIITLWSSYTPVPECHRIIPTFPDAERGIVVRSYADWTKQLLYFERNRAEVGHDDMPPHSHSHIKMIAVK